MIKYNFYFNENKSLETILKALLDDYKEEYLNE